MKKGKLRNKLLKGFILALSLIMIFSVTTYAHTVIWIEAGVSCSGEVGRTSATTSSSSPMYLEAIVYCEYLIGGVWKSTRSEDTNSGTNITAYASIPSGGEVQKTEGAHRAGNGQYHFTNYPWDWA